MANTQKTNHGTRTALELAGIGAHSFASYVGSHFDVDALNSTKAAIALGIDKLEWSEQRAIIVRGKWGTVVRFGQVSWDGNLVKMKGADGAWKVLSVDFIADGSITAMSVGDLAETIIGAGVSGVRVIGRVLACAEYGVGAGESTDGLLYGSHGDSYSALVRAFNGKIVSQDVETDANCYNRENGKLSFVADVGDVQKRFEVLSAKLRKAAGLGGEAELLVVEKKKGKGASKKIASKKVEAIDVTAAAE